VEKHAKDIKRFDMAIRWIRHLEAIFAIIPIKVSLKLWGLSDEFINYMVYPRRAPFRWTAAYDPVWPSSSEQVTLRQTSLR
jgi:hypothetical protein